MALVASGCGHGQSAPGGEEFQEERPKLRRAARVPQPSHRREPVILLTSPSPSLLKRLLQCCRARGVCSSMAVSADGWPGPTTASPTALPRKAREQIRRSCQRYTVAGACSVPNRGAGAAVKQSARLAFRCTRLSLRDAFHSGWGRGVREMTVSRRRLQRWQSPAEGPCQRRRRAQQAPRRQPEHRRLAVGDTVILMTPIFIPIETPTKCRGGCSRMTVSPTASAAPAAAPRRARSTQPAAGPPSQTSSDSTPSAPIARSQLHIAAHAAIRPPTPGPATKAGAGGGGGRAGAGHRISGGAAFSRLGGGGSTLAVGGAAAAAAVLAANRSANIACGTVVRGCCVSR